jgi:hypothetical protein
MVISEQAGLDVVRTELMHMYGLPFIEVFLVLLLLYAHRHPSILGAAGHNILTPANQLMVMGLKIWSLSNPGSNQRPFDHCPTSLPTAVTGPTDLVLILQEGPGLCRALG